MKKQSTFFKKKAQDLTIGESIVATVAIAAVTLVGSYGVACVLEKIDDGLAEKREEKRREHEKLERLERRVKEIENKNE